LAPSRSGTDGPRHTRRRDRPHQPLPRLTSSCPQMRGGDLKRLGRGERGHPSPRRVDGSRPVPNPADLRHRAVPRRRRCEPSNRRRGSRCSSRNACRSSNPAPGWLAPHFVGGRVVKLSLHRFGMCPLPTGGGPAGSASSALVRLYGRRPSPAARPRSRDPRAGHFSARLGEHCAPRLITPRHSRLGAPAISLHLRARLL
jgi:hypothetical protein